MACNSMPTPCPAPQAAAATLADCLPVLYFKTSREDVPRLASAGLQVPRPFFLRAAHERPAGMLYSTRALAGRATATVYTPHKVQQQQLRFGGEGWFGGWQGPATRC